MRTLVDDLEEAAKYIDSRSGGWQPVASRLRARAARVRELEAKSTDRFEAMEDGGPWTVADEVRRETLRALTGPLSPTEPAATPTEKGRAR